MKKITCDKCGNEINTEEQGLLGNVFSDEFVIEFLLEESEASNSEVGKRTDAYDPKDLCVICFRQLLGKIEVAFKEFWV